MDGTMVDNMMVHHKAWQQKLLEMGLELSLEEVKEQIHGVNKEILKRLFGSRYTAEEIVFHAQDKEQRYRTLYKPSLKLIDGLETLLQQSKAAGIRLAVGSAAPVENVDFVLDTLSIRGYFDAVLHAGDVSKGKPDPEIYLRIMERLQLGPAECVVFEDSPTGAEAGVRSGARTIVVTTTHAPEEFGYLNIDRFIRDYTEY